MESHRTTLTVPITTDIYEFYFPPIVKWVYSIKFYVIKFVSNLQQIGGFIHVVWFLINKIGSHDITNVL
jgi:hypothetical protein